MATSFDIAGHFKVVRIILDNDPVDFANWNLRTRDSLDISDLLFLIDDGTPPENLLALAGATSSHSTPSTVEVAAAIARLDRLVRAAIRGTLDAAFILRMGEKKTAAEIYRYVKGRFEDETVGGRMLARKGYFDFRMGA